MDETELARSADNWALAKAQMTDTVASSYFGFSPVTTNVYFDTDGLSQSDIPPAVMMEEIAKLSREYQKKIDAFDGSGEFIEYLKELGDEMNKDQYVKAATSSRYSNSPYTKYVEWYKQRFNES